MSCIFHKWNGCKCSKCGKVRDEGHKWNGCKCSICGKVRDEGHNWNGCKCSICGKTRDEGHEWDLCKGVCTICGKTRVPEHDWDGDVCRRCGMKKPDVGDRIFFGHYYLWNDRDKSELEWTVLDKRENQFLIITKNGIENIPYHNIETDIEWKDCSLRKWLNGRFLQVAFSDAERARIVSGTIRNNGNQQYGIEAQADTEDSVFLLSLEEAKALFANDEERKSCPTPYAKKKGAFASRMEQLGAWWLRTPGAYLKYADFVPTSGNVDLPFGRNVDDKENMVRPVMWITM